MAGRWKFYNFDEEPRIMEAVVPFVNGAANAGTVGLGTTSAVCRAYWRVPRSGVLTDIAFVGEDGVTQSGSNYQTFTGLNLGTLGTGNTSVLVTTAHVNTTDINAVALNGGTNLTAKLPYSLALHATAANLIVAEGEIIEITATATGSGAIVDGAVCMFKLRTLPPGVKGTAVHVGGAGTLSPSALQVLNSVGGEALLGLSATNEAQTARLDGADQLTLDPASGCRFSARLKVSAAAANTRFIFGLASAYTATLDDIVSNAWFRIEGNSLALLVEGDDGTTDTDDQATSPATTVVADTYAVYDISLSGGTARFQVNGLDVGSVSVPLLSASTPLQPILAIQKASGTGAQTMTVDWVAVS